MTNYHQWIAAHLPVDPRGQCAQMTELMVGVFPELRRVRGHYVCPLEGRRPHWWLVTATGEIIDPTVEQFPSCGVGEYEEYTGPEPQGQCLNCGALVFNGSGFCNADCALETAKFMARGGRVVVNGIDITPEQASEQPLDENFAVDPQATDPGKPTPRDTGSSLSSSRSPLRGEARPPAPEIP